MKGSAEIDTTTNMLTGSATGMNYWGEGPTGCLHEESSFNLHKSS
jgi:hypothetical protein